MPARTEPYEAPAIVTFALELTAWREAAELKKTELAAALGYADSYIGQIELCKNIPSENFTKDLDTFFTTNGVFHRLWKRIVDTRLQAHLPPGYREYAALERRAATVRKFEALLITGIFQTPDYARAMLASYLTPDAVEPALAARLERQEILTREERPRVWLTIDEWVLRRAIGGRDVLRAQLRHLLEAGEHPYTIIQVLPHDTDFYVALSGSFTLLGFTDAPEVAYVEAVGLGNLIQVPDAVADCAVRYESLRGHALSVAESRRLIEMVMEEL